MAVIGYSLNDTVVVFDRIRENFPRMLKSQPRDVIKVPRPFLTAGRNNCPDFDKLDREFIQRSWRFKTITEKFVDGAINLESPVQGTLCCIG